MAIRTQHATKPTLDATPTIVYTSPTALTAGFVVHVFAHEAATSDQQWFHVLASRSDGDNSVTSGTITQGGDAGGAGWTIEVQEGTDALEVKITGEAAHTIDWVAFVQYYD